MVETAREQTTAECMTPAELITDFSDDALLWNLQQAVHRNRANRHLESLSNIAEMTQSHRLEVMRGIRTRVFAVPDTEFFGPDPEGKRACRMKHASTVEGSDGFRFQTVFQQGLLQGCRTSLTYFVDGQVLPVSQVETKLSPENRELLQEIGCTNLIRTKSGEWHPFMEGDSLAFAK